MTNSRIFKAASTVDGISYLKDGGLSLRFSTQELSDEDKLIISKFHGKFGWLLFKETNISQDEIPSTDPDDIFKTPSQRLRNVLYVLYEKKYKEVYIDFETFYRQKMERFIDQLKSTI